MAKSRLEKFLYVLDLACKLNKTKSVIKKRGSKWCIFSKSGKLLECKDTKKEAEKRLKQIEFFKNQDK